MRRIFSAIRRLRTWSGFAGEDFLYDVRVAESEGAVSHYLPCFVTLAGKKHCIARASRRHGCLDRLPAVA